jgi:L-lactate dehydrogenase complex protein LldG
MSDRATVLGNIAANLRRGRGAAGEDGAAHQEARLKSGHAPEEIEARLKSGPTTDIAAAVWPPDLLVERFSAALTAVAGRVHRAPDDRAANTTLVTLCRERGVSRLLSWDPRWIALDGLPAALAAADIDLDFGMVPRVDARTARLAALESLQIGLTGALAGIAESGTVAVVSGPGRSRLASLLPPVHVAVLKAERLYSTLEAFFAAHPDVADSGSNLVLITGPSRTADIEMTLTRGVHGPGEVHVVLVGC